MWSALCCIVGSAWIRRRNVTSDAIREEAARWFTRLQSAEAPAEATLSGWQQWMAHDPRHAQEFQALDQVCQEFAVLPRPAPRPRAMLEDDEYDGSISVAEWNARHGHARTRSRS